MARMIPFPMAHTVSSAERRLYEGFLQQLSDEYVVFHSVDWVLASLRPGGPPIEGECDFLIAHPLDGILVIEAKGGELAYDPDSRRWTQSGRGGRHALDEDPFHQARDEMHSLVDILKHEPGWDRWKPSFGYGVAFPDGLYTQDAHPAAPATLAIDRDDMDRLTQRVKEIQRTWRRRERRFGAEGMEALELALGFRVEVRTPLRLQFDEEDRRIFELTQEQAYVLAFVAKRRRAAVFGPAGSGKTLLAIQLAKRLAAAGTDTLLVCFNWRLAGYLRRNTEGTAHLDVLHFHELCRRVAVEAGLDVPEPPVEGVAATSYYERTLPDLLEQATRRLGPRYAAIIVDEAQDFRQEWWGPLMALHREPDRGDLFLFLDSNQNLYGGALPGNLVQDHVPLLANLRNTKPIHEFVSVFYAGEIPPVGTGPSGRPVEVLGYGDEAELARLVALIVQNLGQEGVGLDDIVLLTPAARDKSRLRRQQSVDGVRLSEEPAPGALLACSIHGFKGLERPVVILAELGEHERPYLSQYLYVGGSRAKNHLIVLAEESVARDLRKLAGVQTA